MRSTYVLYAFSQFSNNLFYLFSKITLILKINSMFL